MLYQLSYAHHGVITTGNSLRHASNNFNARPPRKRVGRRGAHPELRPAAFISLAGRAGKCETAHQS
jgi:hypothetical protein